MLVPQVWQSVEHLCLDLTLLKMWEMARIMRVRLRNSLVSLSSSVSKANLCCWRALMRASMASLSSADSVANLCSLRALMCASLAALFSSESIVSLCFPRALLCPCLAALSSSDSSGLSQSEGFSNQISSLAV